ncbi:extracellular solute-binding protein [Ruminococcaceae bacterium OttesenSCG-928-I18]|nr:extracellular solute-binding protein [Ruminococcaceae bacterium OttesenSCG-928-I18]
MKKVLVWVVAAALCLGAFSACSTGDGQQTGTSGEPGASRVEDAGGVELRVVSSFSSTDGNRGVFEQTYQDWEAETGNVVADESQTSDENWKAKVVADFETGSDPDVLFFFNGTDSNSFVQAGRVVPISEIREEYPDYGANMNFASIPASPVDNVQYALPSTGFWEGLYVNKKVLQQAGVEMPGPETTWDTFLETCQAIKDAGYIPIACSLQQVPHYWFEYTIMNNGGPEDHLAVPQAVDDEAFGTWVAGENDIRELYERGFFPEDTLTASDDATSQYIYNDEAAFLLDGSWKMGQFLENVGEERLEDFTVTYVPAKENRSPTDIVGGLSMGWYITQKAWDDPEKRQAAVSFVQAMTTDEVVNAMAAGIAVTALTDQTEEVSVELNALQESAFEMIGGTTSVTPAVQDYITPEAKGQILETDTKLVASGELTPEQAVVNMMQINGGVAIEYEASSVSGEEAPSAGSEVETSEEPVSSGG